MYTYNVNLQILHVSNIYPEVYESILSAVLTLLLFGYENSKDWIMRIFRKSDDMRGKVWITVRFSFLGQTLNKIPNEMIGCARNTSNQRVFLLWISRLSSSRER